MDKPRTRIRRKFKYLEKRKPNLAETIFEGKKQTIEEDSG